MKNSEKETELILNPDGSIYHLSLRPEHVAGTVILVGDPQRVEILSSQFSRVEHKVSNREFITHTGEYKGMRVMVIGTGIGTDNIDIVMNELDALVNVDLQTRMPREEHTSLRIIRLGTTGLLQPDIPVDSVIASEWGLGLDALMHFYRLVPGVLDEELGRAVEQSIAWDPSLGRPYAVRASDPLMEQLTEGMTRGITLTAPGFYGPQGRVLRLEPADPDLINRLSAFSYYGRRILNFEMETSALYGLGKLLGHEVLTLCVAIANRVTGEFSANYKETVRQTARLLLDRLAG